MKVKLMGYAAFCLLVVFVVFSSGCVSGPQVENFDECVAMGYPVMESYPRQCSTPDGRIFTEETGPIGGERDEHGCLVPAGYAWDDEIGACARGWEMSESEKEAAKTAMEYVGQEYATTVIEAASTGPDSYSVYIEQGENRDIIKVEVRDGAVEGSFVTRHTCTEEEKQAEICTMEYAPVCGFKSGESQTYGNGCGACSAGVDYWERGECGSMTLEEARQAAQASVCTEEGTLTEEASYNENSRTWWIGLEPEEEKQGCNPACVVSQDGTAEVNWRCTGALPP